MANDVYARAKAIARLHRKVEKEPDGLHRPETVTIYGPDNEILKTWTIVDKGGHEE